MLDYFLNVKILVGDIDGGANKLARFVMARAYRCLCAGLSVKSDIVASGDAFKVTGSDVIITARNRTPLPRFRFVLFY